MKENGELIAGGLNAGGQISLSRYKEVINLTHQVHIVWKPGQIRQNWNKEQGIGVRCIVQLLMSIAICMWNEVNLAYYCMDTVRLSTVDVMSILAGANWW